MRSTPNSLKCTQPRGNYPKVIKFAKGIRVQVLPKIWVTYLCTVEVVPYVGVSGVNSDMQRHSRSLREVLVDCDGSSCSQEIRMPLYKNNSTRCRSILWVTYIWLYGMVGISLVSVPIFFFSLIERYHNFIFYRHTFIRNIIFINSSSYILLIINCCCRFYNCQWSIIIRFWKF